MSNNDSSSDPLFLGIDVGGTNVKLGLLTATGDLVTSTSFPTRAEKAPDYAIGEIARVVTEIFGQLKLSKSRLAAAGIGTPGPLNIHTGYILEPTNMPGWRHFPVRDELSRALGIPVTFTNDANAAAFGEFWLGSAKENNSLVLLTLGTGVGGGIIIDHHCVEGAHGLGAEIGHIQIDSRAQARMCSCGRPGHLEAYASATALVDRARIQLQQSKSILAEVPELTAHAVYSAALDGDRLAIELIDETADYLATGIGIVAHVIDPEAVLLGGAMTFGGQSSEIGRRFLARIVSQVKIAVFPEILEHLKIDFASLGSDAGFIGAAGLAKVRFSGVG
jgi:glucokinase